MTACRAALPLLAAGLLLVWMQPGAMAQDIGTTLEAENVVEGRLASEMRRIGRGDPVFQDEAISTGAQSAASFRFRDETTLSLGALSTIVLDRFVYDPSRNAGDIVFNAVRGAFRFVTGKANKPDYHLITPTALTGVRGTDLDLYVDRAGNTLVLGRDGEAASCPRNTAQRGRVDGNCCRLNAGRGPVYGVLLLQATRCIGPTSWQGNNPMQILAATASAATLDAPSVQAPTAPPSPPSPPADPEQEEEEEEG